ncbi:MAG: hypothetical protein SFU98_14655 [Leptospiraceae bacterium]|nr:hypothetical protein [Leptospiraceae bacterium]
MKKFFIILSTLILASNCQDKQEVKNVESTTQNEIRRTQAFIYVVQSGDYEMVKYRLDNQESPNNIIGCS